MGQGDNGPLHRHLPGPKQCALLEKSEPDLDTDPYGEIRLWIRMQDIYGKCAEACHGKNKTNLAFSYIFVILF